MNPEDVQQIIKYLSTLADPQVKHILEVAWTQVLYNRAWDVAWIIGSIIYLFSFTSWWKSKDEDSLNEDDKASAVVGIVIGCALCVIVLANTDAIVNTIINPDWMTYSKLSRLILK